MNIEVIDGVAYAIEEAKTSEEASTKCFFADRNCDGWCVKRHSTTTYFRRLTAEEREKLRAALDAGEQCKEGGAN